jgi:hypothetical protein
MDDTTREKIRPYLGKVPDTKLAHRFGVTRQRIGQLRKDMGIAPYKHDNKTTPMCAAMTARDQRETDRAAKKVGQTRSTYVRNAVLEKNKEVLG